MSKMSEIHYEKMQKPQEDCPEIEYDMTYPIKYKFTPKIWTWFDKKYAKAKKIKHYVKAKKVRLPF